MNSYSISISASKSICLVIALLLPGLSFAAEVQELRLWRAPDHTRLVFDLSGNVDYELFTLTNPHRVVVDIENASLNPNFSNPDFNDSPIDGVRSAVREGNTLRVVIDLSVGVDPSSFTLAPNSELGDRLVVDLYDIESTANRTSNTVVTAPVSPSQEKRDIVVAISAGHGGEDPGGIGFDGRLKEKNITLPMSRALFDVLDAMPGYKPVMIRDGDYYVELQQRSQIARDYRADLFVALHTDWYRSSNARGLTIYALSGDRADRENARRVAQKENSADLLGGVGGDIHLESWDDDVALTLLSLQMAWSMEQSLIAGTRILESLDGVTRLRRDKVQQASLEVLKSPDIPSILIETGYLTNPEEARRLNTSSFQRRMTQAIAQGVVNYFYDAPPEGTLIAWQKDNGIVPGSYTVKRGDSLSVIAQRFGVSLAELKSANNLNSNTIHVGQELTIGGISLEPAEHTIARGETLSEIAAQYRVSLSNLRQVNNISGDRIMIGQILKIPSS
jgi:N-acetylmuramoyl-L-alanine amidase